MSERKTDIVLTRLDPVGRRRRELGLPVRDRTPVAVRRAPRFGPPKE